MPDPREAVYDVLLAKKRRAEEVAKAAEEWQRYEEANARATAVDSGRRDRRR